MKVQLTTDQIEILTFLIENRVKYALTFQEFPSQQLKDLYELLKALHTKVE